MEKIEGITTTCPAPLKTGVDRATPTTTSSVQFPNRISVGASLRLSSIEGVALDLGITAEAATGLLATLGCPLVRLPSNPKQYVNVYGFESALFTLTLPPTMCRTADGAQDLDLIRLHQELAGAMYLAATAEAIRERVKKLARAFGKSLTKKTLTPIISRRKS